MEKTWVWVCALLSSVLVAECYLPRDISNFQNEYVCDSDVRLVRPLSIGDVEKAVRRHAQVRAVGTGHSWNTIYCAPSSETEDRSDTSANIVMTTIRPLKIEVNEEESSVWVSAGVIIWDLMIYLANYHTPSAPRGYVAMGTPLFVNQTVAGAAATGTHGSSLKHGSFSNQVLAVKVILANGTSVEISDESHLFLMKAFRVNVGRLGVVTDVKLKIFPETLAQRILKSAIPSQEFMYRFKIAQEMFKQTGTLPDWLDGTNIWWMVRNSTFDVHTFENLEGTERKTKSECFFEDCPVPDEDSVLFLERLEQTKINSPMNLSRSEAYADIADGVHWEYPKPFPTDPTLLDPRVAFSTEASLTAATETLWNNATVETQAATFTSWPEFADGLVRTLSDDYSIGVPVDKMADCVEGAMSILNNQMPDHGLRGAMLLRFVGKDDALLAATHSKPYMRLDILDYPYYHQQPRSRNEPLKKLLAFFVTSPVCSPVRLHWGKAGWPDPGCWNGADEYKDTWCDFGCAVLKLDPHGKFIGGDPDVWNWNGANLEKCCTPDGYDASLEGCGCDVIPVRTPDECPEAPFFTNR